ncbi:hypothetical protein K4749_01320 [Streptomyces sp. TRM72054]|uniref:hypothetical protein n=1 Tax=Streptomyces sp. TRM72054 TaxID=2870562 RepID=UPI001C8B2B8E|nr:hypothetical protein [Streptomyces sp. TRM72054]MBX9392271.1 hypothetical protein [Streptomyces sp. TRM72054]
MISHPYTLRIGRRDDKVGHVVELDGHDIANAVLGLTVTFKGGEPPLATLDLVLDEIPTETDEVRVHMPEATRELLVRLGWTPPAEEATP